MTLVVAALMSVLSPKPASASEVFRVGTAPLVTLPGMAKEPTGSPTLSHGLALSALGGCTSCEFDRYVEDPTAWGQPFENHWVYNIGSHQCEDGASTLGPCVTCEGFGCDDLTVWLDVENLCSLELCNPQHRGGQQLALEALEDGDVVALTSILVASDVVRLAVDGASIELVSCGGTVSSIIPLSHRVAFELREAMGSSGARKP
jgi:hypothetical protein